jgi:hypothetical protein
LQIRARSGADDRTVIRYYRGDDLRSVSVVRIEQALAELGLPPRGASQPETTTEPSQA